MVTRIVKMTFKEEACDKFVALFEHYKVRIRNAEGCESLTLLRQSGNGNIFFTYSLWRDENFLNAYRDSATFAEVWPKTKALFAAPAEAWTNEALHIL